LAAELIAQLSRAQSPFVRIRNSYGKGMATGVDELTALVSYLEGLAQGGGSLIQRPYPTPDNDSPAGSWIWSIYTEETLRQLVEQVHRNALIIYNDLVDTYFPSLRSTLGLACIMPVCFRGNLIVAEDGLATLQSKMEPALSSQDSYVEITLAREPMGDFLNVDEWHAKMEREYRAWRMARPGTEGWARPRMVNGILKVFKDAPATSQAYDWLWNDLKALHLVHRQPPHGEDW
jgi:hypothetical protein